MSGARPGNATRQRALEEETAMKWGIFSLSQIPDQSRRVAAFEADLRQFELAEELGYDKVWIAEHLFSTYGVVTSTQVYAAAIAQRTKRLRIGMAVVAIPFNHPLRTASEMKRRFGITEFVLWFSIGGIDPAHAERCGLPAST
jgi:Luciferase-like monooxygenase